MPKYYVKFGVEVEAESAEEAEIEGYKALEDEPGFFELVSVEKDW